MFPSGKTCQDLRRGTALQVTYSACMLACLTRDGFDRLGMIPVYKHTILEIRIMVVVDNHYISGTDVAIKNMCFYSGFVSCNVHQNTVIRW